MRLFNPTFFFAMIAFLISSHAFGAATNPENSKCWQSIFAADPTRQISPENLNCVLKKSEVQSAVLQLCSKNFNQITPPFEKYLYYSKKFQDAYQSWNKATDPREKSQLLNTWAQLKDDWTIFGYHSEIESILWSIWAASDRCHRQTH